MCEADACGRAARPRLANEQALGVGERSRLARAIAMPCRGGLRYPTAGLSAAAEVKLHPALDLGRGPETTQVYPHTNMTIKEQALARVQQPGTSPGSTGPPTPCSRSESPLLRVAASGRPGHDRALAPRHRPAPLDGAVDARQDRPAGHPPHPQGPR